MTQTREAAGASGRLGDELKRHPLFAVTFVGGVLYVLAFDSYRGSLRPFGLIPSEVGIDYAAVVWPVVKAIGFVGLVLSFFYLGVRVNHPRFASTAIALMVPVLVIAPTALALAEERAFVASVRAGRAYRPLLTSRLQVLASLRAEPVQLVWKDGADSRTPLPDREWLYLGAADGVAVLYSHDPAETIRVPAADVVIRWAASP